MTHQDEDQGAPPARQMSLSPRQAWFVFAGGLAVVLMFAFVILPYVDPKPAKLSGDKLADFDLEVIGGEAGSRLALADLRGKPVVIDFWASWCQPCREQSAALSAVTARHEGEQHFLGIATGDEQSAAEAFVQEHEPAYLNVFDEGGVVARSIGVRALPTLVILDSDGTVRSMSSRTFTEDELEAHLTQVLK